KFFNDKVLTKNGKYNCKQDNNFNIKYSEEDRLNEYEKFIQYLKFDFINHFNTKRAWMPSYDAKWIKEKIDNKVQEMLTTIKDENIYKKYKFEIFEIDIETGEKKQNLIVLRR
ncbi:MAG: hypothetical protein J6C46_04800, partial [Clostridia bacterium]|nr:hypothetical protein [Clostridia bacterium]